ncbi:PREDICTED: uncharacterized protein LOC109157267 [Ipomoea nil]|uniref:uncharacterized protein LOC109157267 n=1 Tax=Ipomoea nil TaxID=35883 RepID=UPI000900C40F|nr:PREDICTED: uncharacterized protein LOC109157267 [Ipomoea nil]
MVDSRQLSRLSVAAAGLVERTRIDVATSVVVVVPLSVVAVVGSMAAVDMGVVVTAIAEEEIRLHARSADIGSPQLWILDTGATNHMTPDIVALSTSEEYVGNDTLRVRNGMGLSISHDITTKEILLRGNSSGGYTRYRYQEAPPTQTAPWAESILHHDVIIAASDSVRTGPPPEPVLPDEPMQADYMQPASSSGELVEAAWRPRGRSTRSTVRTHSMMTCSKSQVPPTALATQVCPMEPTCYTQAVKYPEWHEAMDQEFNALLQNQTWSLVSNTIGMNVIGCKWMFRMKRKANCTIDRHKIMQLDVHNAFLNGNLDETVYMKQPPGYIGASFPNHRYMNDILKRAGMAECKPLSTPISISKTVSFSAELYDDPTQYSSLMKHVLRYVKGTVEFGLRVRKSRYKEIHAFSDSDWVGCPEDCKSISGFAVFLGTNLISWVYKKQRTVARSSTDAEYKALADVCAEVLWIISLIREINVLGISIPKL